MKWCISLPEETILVVRPSFNAICWGVKPAAKLLGTLLYRHSIRAEHQAEAQNMNEVRRAEGYAPNQDTTCTIYRKQSQLVADMCDEVTEKTLHDTAVPTLQLLGYLDIEEHMQCNSYTLHIDRIEAALQVYKENRDQLEKFLISSLQLEKFLISTDKGVDQLEKFPIDKKYFLSQLEKVLIWNRNISNCRRGRRPASGEARRGKKKSPKSNKITYKINKEEESDASASSSTHAYKKEVTPTGETHGDHHSGSESAQSTVVGVQPHAVEKDTQSAEDSAHGAVCHHEDAGTDEPGTNHSNQITPPAYSRTIPPTEENHATNPHHRGTTTAGGHLPAVPHSGNDGLEHSVSDSPVLPDTTNRPDATKRATSAGDTPTTVKGSAVPAGATRGGGKGSRKGGVTPPRSVGKKARNQITLQGQHILDLYQELRGRRITSNDGNIRAANGLGDVVESDEDFREVYQEIQDDPFLNRNNVTRDLDFLYRKYDGYFDRVVKRRKAALRIVSSQSCESMEAAKERARVNNLAAMEKLQAMKAKKLAATRGA